jgi:acetyl esterase/lipase
VFGRGGSRELRCDVYRPAAALAKHTAVLHVHGGGFRRGDKSGARVARPLAALGYTCISATYRILDEATWSAQLHDVKTAIRWVRSNASQLGVEPQKLAILGYSAGGHLALIASGTQNDPAYDGGGGTAAPGVGTELAACVAFYPGTGAAPGTNHDVLGSNPTDETIRSFRVAEHVKPGFPPTLLLHGTEDRIVPMDGTLGLYQALRDAGTPAELHVIEGMTHIFDGHTDIAEASARWIDLFLDRHVANPRAYPSTEPPR